MIRVKLSSIHAGYQRFRALGVRFRQPPASLVPMPPAPLEDTCGNLIQPFQPQQ